MVSWTPLPEYQAQKRRQNRNSSDQKKGSLSPAQPLHPKKTSECSTSFKGCEKVPGDLSRNLCELGINLYHLNLRQLYEKLKDEILFLGISSCLGFKKNGRGILIVCFFGVLWMVGEYSYGGKFEWQLFVRNTSL